MTVGTFSVAVHPMRSLPPLMLRLPVDSSSDTQSVNKFCVPLSICYRSPTETAGGSIFDVNMLNKY